MPVSSDRMDQLRCETENSLKSLVDLIKNGWPLTNDACDMSVHEYWNCREELSVIDGIIYKGSKIVIPTSMRKLILEKIHQGLLGMDKSARNVFVKLCIGHVLMQLSQNWSVQNLPEIQTTAPGRTTDST